MEEINNLSFSLTNFDWEGLFVRTGIIALKLLFIILIYFIIKNIANRFISKLFQAYIHKKSISAGRAYTLESLTKNLLSYLLIFILVVTVLQTFGIEATAVLAGAGIVGLAIGFGAQGLVSDIVTGFFLLLEKQLDVGDLITIENFSGTVEQVGLRTTQIRSADGTLHYIPNREITSLSNHSRGDMQALVDIVVSKENDIPVTLDILQQLCDSIAKENEVITDGPNVIGIQSMSSTTVTIRILAKTKNMEQWGVERLILQQLKEAMDKYHIKTPTPSQLLLEKNEQ